MKKLTLVFALLLLFGLAMSFADDQVSFDVSGDATMTFGIDLNNQANGFKNEATNSLTVTMIAEQTKDKGADADVYGYIELADFQWAVSSSSAVTTDPTVTAKIKADPIWVGIYSAPSISSADKVEIVDSNDTAATTTYSSSGGVTIGYDSDVVDFSVELASEADWENTGDGYAVETDLTVSVSPLTLAASADMGFGYATNPIGFAVKPSLSLDLGAPLSLEPYAAFDGEFANSALTWEAGGGLVLNLSEADADDNMTNLTVKGSYSEATDADVAVSFTELDGDDGVVPALGASVSVEAINLTSTMGWNLEVAANYDVSDTVNVYGGFGYGSDEVLNLNAGVKLSMIANTTFTLDYTSDDINTDNGTVTFATKISY